MKWRADRGSALAWGLGLLGFSALGAWVTSLWVGAGWSNGPRVGGVGTVDLSAGGLVIGRYYRESIAETLAARTRPGVWVSAGAFRAPQWLLERRQFPSATNTAYEYITIPLWPAVVIMCMVGAFAWTLDVRRRRRVGAGRCHRCGYDRRGLAADTKCPECGAATHMGEGRSASRRGG